MLILIILGFFVLLAIMAATAFYGSGWIADRFLGFLWSGGNDNYEVQPQYSIPRARIQAGKFEEAIDEFRKASALYPKDLTVHFHIAHVLAENLKRPLDALAELDEGQKRARTPDEVASFVAERAEIFARFMRNPRAAVLEIETFLKQYPEAKAAVPLNEKLKIFRQRLERGEAEAAGDDAEASETPV